MNKSPLSISWPGWLLFAFMVIAPPAAVAKFVPTTTNNPLVAFGLLLAYEVLVCLGIVMTAVIKKIWERRGDTWVDASTGRAEKIVRLLFAGARRRYQTFFRYEYADLDMKGISTRGTYTLDLEQVFVEVRIDPTPAHKASADPIHLPLELMSGTHDVWDYLTLLDQHLVILGAPGSGKTTLLKHLGLSLVQNRRQRKPRTKQLPWTTPLFLPLREHSSRLKDQRDYSLVDAANMQIHKWKQSIPPEWIEGLLQKGRCLVLLDGLDEIADTGHRQQMVDWAQDQMLAYPKNRFVITSRPLGYRSNPLDRVAVLEVQPFTFEQVTQFLQAWYLANEIKRAVRDDPGVRMRANADAEDLLKRLHTTPPSFLWQSIPCCLP